MDYNSLVAPKGTTGSILNWVGYSKLDTTTVVDEAQLLLYEILRVREMRTVFTFGMAVSQAASALPTRFLDPVGPIFDLTNGTEYVQLGNLNDLQRRRTFDNSLSGTFGTNPFTTTSGSALVAVQKTSHGFNQDSSITIPNGPTVNGLSMTGSFAISSITDANNFVMLIDNDTTANATGAGGGAGVTYTGNNLIAGSASCWSVIDEKFKFDTAFDTQATCRIPYYRQPLLLSIANPSNFVTVRYPKLMRIACMAAAADYMRDDTEYQKQVGALNNLIQTTAINDDLSLRGAVFGTDTP